VERKGLRASTYMLITVCMLLLCVLGTVACSTDQAKEALPTSSPVVVQRSCGSISQLGRGPSTVTGNSDPQQVGDCFWHAYQQCTATASFNFVTSSIDTVLIRTFQTQKTGSGCQVLDKVQMRIVPHPPRVKQVYTCASVKKLASALQILNCQGDGTITISLLK